MPIHTRLAKLLRILLVGSAVWIAFVLALDLRYEMFPRVLVGGLKILCSGYALLLALVVVNVGAQWMLRSLFTRSGHD